MVEYSAELQEICLPFLEEMEARVVLNAMSPVALPAGADLCVADSPADSMYLLAAGRVAVRKKTGFGDRMQVVALLDPGAPIGENGLLDGRTRGATLTAVSDSQLLMLSRAAFEELSALDSGLALKLLKWLMGKISLRLQKSSERLAHIL